MGKYLTILLILVLALNSCSNSDPVEDPGNHNNDSLWKETVFSIGDNISFDYSEIIGYDSSTHIVYFRENHPEFDKLRQIPFIFYADGNPIYEGLLWPNYFSSFPDGSYISSSPMAYQNYALRIEYIKNTKPDLRNDIRIIQSLKNRNLLHSGLQVNLKSVEISGPLARLSYTVTNLDQSTLLILDPGKMGSRLFHYYTNGLYLQNTDDNTIINSELDYQEPVPANGWSMDWLTMLSTGATKEFTLSYSFTSDVKTGNYNAYFEFPGLANQVEIHDLVQVTGRIWLGDITAVKNISVN